MMDVEIQDSWLRRAVEGYLAQNPALGLRVADGPSDIKITVTDHNLSLLAEGHEIESHDLPARLPHVMSDLVWLAARRQEDAQKTIPLNADYILEPRDFRLCSGEQSVTLTGREVALLQFMLTAGECSKEILLERVWRYHPESTTHTVETHLWRLRQKLQQAGMTAPLIITTDNGYRIA